MPVIKNINPLGQVDLPLIMREGDPLDEHGVGCLEPGEEFEVTAEHARMLLPQTLNYEPVDAEAHQILEALQAEAEPAEDPVPADPAATPAAGEDTSTPPAAGDPAPAADAATPKGEAQ
ncbi:hypothetical protein ACSMXN_09265 [Jatrophihabitans sp. DSM 45814]